MNRETPHLMQFVLYSVKELVASDGAGFWSNDDGWVEFKFATKFTLETVPSCNLPITEGQDAKWIVWESTAPSDHHRAHTEAQMSLRLAQSH